MSEGCCDDLPEPIGCPVILRGRRWETLGQERLGVEATP